eukprot:CAMPEP_0170607538 /NCGR_PEP_ID=MMETSP0224-20130122/21108_1 /TAXON_ID=285029 /ORGANISM="Togula jolla, Strain CCCM 725" /LENGTH=249 /DNA_ID=CAMNT_0010932711 /DNA_START=65 /DNA_END=811 /DNA_ORIENTATION=-
MFALLLAAAVSFIWPQGSSALSIAGSVASESAQKKVTVELFYETLCPTCAAYISEEIAAVWFDKELREHVQFDMYPFGNGYAHASEDGSEYSFECQHGEIECMGNMIQHCAMEVSDGPDAYMPMIICMEQAATTLVEEIGKSCAADQGISWSDISDCIDSAKAQKDMYEIALYSNSLDPERLFVPWVQVDGKHDEMADQRWQLKKSICDALHSKGVSTPASCLSEESLLRVRSNRTEEMRRKWPVCMRS